MDEQHVTSHWGLSPAVDLEIYAQLNASEKAPEAGGSVAGAASKDPLLILQVASYDARHTLQTICHSRRHLAQHEGPVQLHVYEEEPELLARHVLLLSILLDDKLTGRDRVETLLEIHGNVFLREKTAKYLDARAKELEQLLVSLSDGGDGKGKGLDWLADILDLSVLKYQQRDLVVEAMSKCREKTSYDMVKAWDARGRKFYGDRFDFRKNMVDWDYHMRLAAAGTPGQDVEKGSIIHFHHFRFWYLI